MKFEICIMAPGHPLTSFEVCRVLHRFCDQLHRGVFEGKDELVDGAQGEMKVSAGDIFKDEPKLTVRYRGQWEK